MSIKSELTNTASYLRSARKAVLGRGGEISATAGLKDLPEAIFNIPADTSLAFQEDSSIAYEKSVPSGAEEYALVKSLGGMTYKVPVESRNLCVADGVYDLNNKTTLELFLGELEDGEYYLSLEGDIDVYYMHIVGESLPYSNPITFDVGELNRNNLYMRLNSEYEQNGEGEYYMSGTITGIMICKADEEDKSYEPHLKYELQDTKPTSLESRGAQLIPYSSEPIDTLELPEAVQALDGWGLGIDAEYNNHIEWRNGRIFYVRMLDELDLGDFAWRLFTSTKYFVTYPEYSSEAWESVDLQECTGNEYGVALCENYEIRPANNIASDVTLDKSIGFINPNTKYGRIIYLRNNEYTSTKLLKESLVGEKFIYALKTPIETDITHLFNDTSPFLKIASGGTVIANNRDKVAIPSTIKCVVKVGA